MKSILLSILMLSATSQVYAQEGASAMQFGREEAPAPARGVLPFLGFGGGYTGYENVEAVEGTPATMKLLGSWYLESPWVFDLGYGINNQQFTSDLAPETARTEGALELAARFRTANRWQFGVIANQLFDQGDAYSADQADAQFVGLQVLKEFNMSPSWLARLGVRAQSLTNNTDGLVNMYLIDFQIGWNPAAYMATATTAAASDESVEDAVEDAMEMEATEPARPVAETQPQPILEEVTYATIAGGSSIQFGISGTQIAERDRQKLERIAKALNENPDIVDRVEVRGYADATGPAAVNQRISQQRADRVRNILQQSGLSNVDVASVGEGSKQSSGLNPDDRRAELVFIGVKDEEALRNILSNIE